MSNNPDGRPSAGLTESVQIIRGPSELLDAARRAADKQGIAVAEWWRRAARARLGWKETE